MAPEKKCRKKVFCLDYGMLWSNLQLRFLGKNRIPLSSIFMSTMTDGGLDVLSRILYHTEVILSYCYVHSSLNHGVVDVAASIVY